MENNTISFGFESKEYNELKNRLIEDEFQILSLRDTLVQIAIDVN